MVRVTEFDPSAFLDDAEVVAEYLTASLEEATRTSSSLRSAMWSRRGA
jgi:DNA-binding phage protein